MSDVFQLYWKELDSGKTTERLGQWFCNRFITSAWPQLYYAEHIKAIHLICEWLTDHQYGNTIPPYTKEWKVIKTRSNERR